ncbi:TPA: hypothetical protein N0F65_007385 [Lagenidium giganteum]|uniref:Uncharacterized protein n=1 Tax=Lagenidium giganteum TaxID=4803 RepID=A0AAV2YI92_9STRA|nr:TPA: hypothetical protein N0F65_007385 [Lagenidium giganteum]
MTISASENIDGKYLGELNAMFFADSVNEAGDAEPPIYIAVCPDLKSCEALVLESPVEVLEARKVCRVFVTVRLYWTSAHHTNHLIPSTFAV